MNVLILSAFRNLLYPAIRTMVLYLPVFIGLTVASAQIPPSENIVPEITGIEFKGNETFGSGQLKEALLSKESPGGFSKFLYRTFGEKLGSKPEYFDPATFEGDIIRLREFYEDNGFYSVVITGDSKIDSNEHTINLLFLIQENKRSLIDSISYRGLEQVAPQLKAEIFKEPIIQRGSPYIERLAIAEINRVLGMLANNGYPIARFNAEKSYKHRYLSTNNFILEFFFETGGFVQFGDVPIHVDPPREDITENIVVRQLDFKPGETYSREKKVSSERSINRIGLFETARVEHGDIPPDSLSPSRVPMEVYVRPRPRNELSPELSVSDENNAFNLGIGIGYTNRNFFGDARSFNAKVRGRSQDIQRWNFGEVFGGRGFRDPSVVGAVELQAQILQPYFFTRGLSFSLTATVSAEKQPLYILSIDRK